MGMNTNVEAVPVTLNAAPGIRSPKKAVEAESGKTKAEETDGKKETQAFALWLAAAGLTAPLPQSPVSKEGEVQASAPEAGKSSPIQPTAELQIPELTAASAPQTAEAKPQVAASAPVLLSSAAPEEAETGQAGSKPEKSAPAFRRKNLGTVDLEETFPEGWERLLDEAGAAPGTESGQEGKKTAESRISGQEPKIPGGSEPLGPEVREESAIGTLFPEMQQAQPQLKAEAVKAAVPEEPRPRTIRPPEPVKNQKAENKNEARGGGEATVLAAPNRLQSEGHSAPVGKSSPGPAGLILEKMSAAQKENAVQVFSQTVLENLKTKPESMTVELHPPELGQVRITVESKSGQLDAAMTMKDKAVGEFFQERIPDIRKSLEEAGLKMGSLSVEVRSDWTPGNQPEENREGAAWTEPQRREPDGVRAGPAEAGRGGGSRGEKGKVDMLV